MHDQAGSTIAWSQAVRTGLVDAVVWVWFLQSVYVSRFTEQLPHFASMAKIAPFYSVGACLVMSAALMALRWNAIPRPYRVACSLASCLSTGALYAIPLLGLAGSAIDVIVYLVFVASYYGSQVLRIETLGTCRDVRTLLAALIVSFVSYYVITCVVLVVPQKMYNAFVIVAPLAFLCRPYRTLNGRKGPDHAPASEVPASLRGERAASPSAISADAPDGEAVAVVPKRDAWKSLLNPPTLLLVLFGIAGGLISAAGGSNPALDLATVFTQPSPAHLLMVLANMALGIMAAQTFQLRRGMFYALMSIIWMAGSFLGAFVFALFPGIPPLAFTVIAMVAALAIAFSFVVNQDMWIRQKRPAGNRSGAVDALATSKGLTRRETEVLHLLMEGRSVPYIQEKLYISEGTARTHVKHIYQKTGVHSRQELLDLLER